jgi:hypothetical protein
MIWYHPAVFPHWTDRRYGWAHFRFEQGVVVPVCRHQHDSSHSATAVAAWGCRPGRHHLGGEKTNWKINAIIPIDISWVDWAYKSSTCDVMYCRHSAAIYIMVIKFRNTICPLPPQLTLRRRAVRCHTIQTEHGPYLAERTLYCEMSAIIPVQSIDMVTLSLERPPHPFPLCANCTNKCEISFNGRNIQQKLSLYFKKCW